MRQIIVIPARYESSRLPGKPLLSLLGVSMLRRTYARCGAAFPSGDIYVATDDQRIFDHCVEFDMQVLMTSPDCLTGTDRVAEVARQVEADVYINVQGDEPLMNPQDIHTIAEASRTYPDAVINGVAEISSEEQFRSPTIPKVVMRPDGRLLYMSRGSIPTTKSHAFKRGWRQVCTYAFPASALRDFASTDGKTQLEQIEDIEILRFLELGYEVRMVPMSDESISIDIPEDIARVERALVARGLVDVD